jgi:CRISPR-associated protein Cas1
MGIEGAFARNYFKHYFSMFERKLSKGFRSKNPPQDPVNAMLSFVYMLTYHNITAKLYMRGFDPSISYLHTPFRNHFALSSDIMETLRADINIFVANLFLNNTLTTSDFTNKGGVYLKYTSRINLWKILKPFMNKINKKVNKQIIKLKKEISKSKI